MRILRRPTPQKRPRVACLIGPKKGAVLLKDKGWNSFDPITVWSLSNSKIEIFSEQNIMSSAVPLKTITFYLYRPDLWERKTVKECVFYAGAGNTQAEIVCVRELTQTQADFEGPGLVKPLQVLISRRHDELWKDPSSLNMSSSALSHKNLLAPLLVSKQSVSPAPSLSLCSYLAVLSR